MDKLDVKIGNVLRDIGIPVNILGYQYIRKAIKLCLYDNSYSYNITKMLYPEIAKQCDTTASRAERAIRHAIEKACLIGNLELQQNIFGHTISPNKGKPTNSEFIAAVVEYIYANIETKAKAD